MTSIKSFKVGGGTITSIFDGYLEIGADAFTGITESEVATCLKAVGRGPGPVPASLNAFIYQEAGKTVLIDSGGKDVFPDLGGLQRGLHDMGLEPGDIDVILCTHLHPDHIGGLIENGRPVFAHADLMVSEADRQFWLNAEHRERAPDMFKAFFDLAHAVVNAYGERLSTFVGAATVLPTIEAVPLPGHTPGHTGYQIGDGEDGLLIWGDIVHVPAFQLPQPKAAIAFDVDKALAVETRIAMFERAVSDRVRVAGMHLHHPGIGHITRLSEGFGFEAASPLEA